MFGEILVQLEWTMTKKQDPEMEEGCCKDNILLYIGWILADEIWAMVGLELNTWDPERGGDFISF